MQLYVQVWLLDKDGNRVKQNMAITIHHPEAMTDEKAEQLLESLKDELLQKWGDDYTLESIDFVPEQNLDMKIVEGGEIHSWHNLYYRVVALSVKDMQIDFRTDALFSVNLGKNPLLVNRQIKETIRSELFNTYKENTGLDAYDIPFTGIQKPPQNCLPKSCGKTVWKSFRAKSIIIKTHIVKEILYESGY